MTDERDDRIGKRYRELPREEPPSALDESILAAARRELETRPAPLVAPTGRRRWMFPVAAAAVIVLSAVVTLHVQREQPDLELASAPPPVASPSAPTEKEEKAGPAPAPEAPAERPAASEQKYADRRIARSREEAELRRDAPGATATGPSVASPAAKEPAAAAAVPPPAAQPPVLADNVQSKAAGETRRFVPDPAAIPPPQMAQRPAPATAPAPAAAPERDAAQGPRESLSKRAEMMAKSEAVAEPPERMLERIATLRREGRHKEADELYAEFRRRFPDYRIPEAMREQVLPR